MLPRLALPLLIACLAASVVMSLSACGFHLRGQQKLPFDSLAVPGNTPLTAELKRAVSAASATRVQEEVAGADAVLAIQRETTEKVILSLSSAGSVREFQLRYLVNYSVRRTQGGYFIPPTTLILTRDMTFNSDQVLSKETEEAMLYKEMRSDFVQQLMRRMASAKPIVVQ
jgi:LPS-assembly lipoprotein